MEMLKSFSITGTDREEFLSAVKEFQQKTEFIEIFDLSQVKVMHIADEQNNEQYIKLIDCDTLSQTINTLKPVIKTIGINKDTVPPAILESINNKVLNTCIKYAGKIYFVDENCRSMFSSKTSVSGSYLYDGTLFADIALQNALRNFTPTGKLTIKYPMGVVRHENGVNLIIALLADGNYPIDLSKLSELNDKRYKMSNWEVKQYMTSLEFELDDDINGFIPCIRITWSDAGKGILNKYVSLKNPGCKSSVILEEISNTDNAYEYATNLIEKLTRSLNKNITNPYLRLAKNTKFASIGKSRLTQFIKPLFEGKSTISRRDFISKILTIPDLVGNINDSTNKNIELSIGNEIKLTA